MSLPILLLWKDQDPSQMSWWIDRRCTPGNRLS
jgi:hypothetical protein